jgi:hypothetical protein
MELDRNRNEEEQQSALRRKRNSHIGTWKEVPRKTNRTRRPTSYFLVMYLGLMIAVVLITGNFPLPAQVNSPGSAIVIRGKITDAKSQELIVAAGNGALSVKVPDTTIVRGETTIDQELWLSESCPNLLG